MKIYAAGRAQGGNYEARKYVIHIVQTWYFIFSVFGRKIENLSPTQNTGLCSKY